MKEIKLLITAPEVVRLHIEQGYTQDIAVEIAEEWKRQSPYKDSPTFDYMALLSAVYEAGRIQGMREVRTKAKK